MDMENAGELVTLGTDIVRLGGEMKIARSELVAAQARVSALEAEMQPKLMRHAQLIQAAAGLAFSVPQAAPVAPAPTAAPLPDWAPPVAHLMGPDGIKATSTAPAAPGPDLGLRRGSTNPALTADGQLKQRVKDYLKRHNGDEGISSTDVAEHLRVDPLLVREAMREMQSGR